MEDLFKCPLIKYHQTKHCIGEFMTKRYDVIDSLEIFTMLVKRALVFSREFEFKHFDNSLSTFTGTRTTRKRCSNN